MMHNLKTMQAAFYQSESDQPHPGRARTIIKAHPEVRQLMVRNPWTALIALSVVVVQTSLAFCFGKLGFGYWWLSLVIAYCVGAFANHANYVIIHDATHNLIFRNKSWNKLVGILADLPNLNPGAMGFRVIICAIIRIRAITNTMPTWPTIGRRAWSATNGIVKRFG